MIVAVLIFVVILSILVLIHELGHFIMAKRAKIGVEEFGFGLPPRLWGKKVGETIYSVNWLPLGGFVKLVGEDPTDSRKKDKNSFWSKSILERSSVILAGVFMNLILAVLIFYVLIIFSGFSMPFDSSRFDYKFRGVNIEQTVIISGVVEGSPAELAGIKSAEFIQEINGEKINTIEGLQNVVRANQDKEIVVRLVDFETKDERTVNVTPKFDDELGNAAIGVGLGEVSLIKYDTFVQKAFSGFIHAYNVVILNFTALGSIIGGAVESGDIKPVGDVVSGPVGIAYLTSFIVGTGEFLPILELAATISLSLGILNLLPIPALDGGRFAFLVYEIITRRKPNASVEKWIHTAGFAAVIFLAIVVTYNDIIKIVNKQLPF